MFNDVFIAYFVCNFHRLLYKNMPTFLKKIANNNDKADIQRIIDVKRNREQHGFKDKTHTIRSRPTSFAPVVTLN